MAFDTKPVNKVSDADWFLRESSEKLGWKDLSEDIVMDIGSGSGKSSTTFLELFPNVKKVIAIDLHKKNAEEAQANNPHEKLEYEVANIQERSTLEQWEGKISKVISIYCFNTLRWMAVGFENMWHLLQFQGEAALLIKLPGPMDELLEQLYRDDEWNRYLAPAADVMPPESLVPINEEHYRTNAIVYGFEVIECETGERVYDYESEDEFKNSLFHAIPVVRRIPYSLEMKFKDFLSESMLQLSPKTEEGKFCIRNNVLSLLLRKKK